MHDLLAACRKRSQRRGVRCLLRVLCESGRAGRRLLEAGAEKAYPPAGAIQAWKEAGVPLTRLEPAGGRADHGHL